MGKNGILYLDCFSGISGDMFLGAMLDLGLDVDDFLNELKKIPLTDYEIDIKQSIKGGITGYDVHIHTKEQHPHRGLKAIYEIIDNSTLNTKVKQCSKDAFYRLATVEGKIHGKSPEEIHFHEVGAVDSIIDIIGACIVMDMLKPSQVYASPINVGYGMVKCAHGTLPVPAPATLELLKGIPVYPGEERGENTTPTGALILAMFVDEFGNLPPGITKKIGYGLGKTERKSPNVLRTILLQNSQDHSEKKHFEHDEVTLLEANIDDMNPQIYEEVMQSFFDKGALDVYLTPIIMKKGRPAIKLSCLCPLDKKHIIKEAILRETTTIGVREMNVARTKLYRELVEIETELGNIQGKIAKKGDEIIRITPEYEDVKRLARDKGIPVIEAYEKMRRWTLNLSE